MLGAFRLPERIRTRLEIEADSELGIPMIVKRIAEPAFLGRSCESRAAGHDWSSAGGDRTAAWARVGRGNISVRGTVAGENQVCFEAGVAHIRAAGFGFPYCWRPTQEGTMEKALAVFPIPPKSGCGKDTRHRAFYSDLQKQYPAFQLDVCDESHAKMRYGYARAQRCVRAQKSNGSRTQFYAAAARRLMVAASGGCFGDRAVTRSITCGSRSTGSLRNMYSSTSHRMASGMHQYAESKMMGWFGKRCLMRHATACASMPSIV